MSYSNKFTSFAGAEEEEHNLPVAVVPKAKAAPKKQIVIKQKVAEGDMTGYEA